MKLRTRKLLSFLFIVASLGIVLVIAFSNNELGSAWETLFTLHPGWLAGAGVCWFCYLFFDALAYHYFLRRQHHPVKLRSNLYVSLMGFYYANITPGASGGEPMQIYYMTKLNIPVGIGTSAVALKLLCNQFMTVLLASVLWLCNATFIDVQLAGAKWAVILGWIVNFAAVPLVLLAALHRPLVQRVVNFGLRLGVKMRLIKNLAVAEVHVNTMLDTYHESVLRVGRSPKEILLQLLMSAASLLGLMGVPVFVYYAFGQTGVPWYQLLTISFLLYISASYTPLPGGSGAQEGGFLVYFRGLFAASSIGLALLVWRFITFYLFLLLGAIAVLISGIRMVRKRSAAQAKKPES
ncbi:MAG: lysylphosphatidylglycerol synthase transmembrane domain-containing protein [Clostridia bacterium]